MVASIAIRAVYLAQAWDGPILALHRSPMSDMHFNHLVAKQVAKGDLLLAEPLHPFHQWHEALAARYFAANPGAERELALAWQGPGEPPPPARRLWDVWYGGNTFHQEPLYAYLLGASYALAGESPLPMLLFQLAAGVLGNVLVALVARRCFGDLAGALAGVLAVLCAPLLYYELVLLRDSLVATLGMALVWLVLRAIERPSALRFAALGAAGGVGLLAKSSLALFLAGVLAWLCATYLREPRRLAARAGSFLVVLGLLLAPAVARNRVVGAPALALSSVGAITFVAANTEDYGRTGEIAGEFFVSEQHAAGVMGRTGGRLVPAALAALATHDHVPSYLGQLATKLGAILWWYEIPNNTNFLHFGLHASVLRWLPVTFALIGPLAVLGLALSAPAFRRIWPLELFVATSLAVLLGFGVFSRLRLSLVPALIPFAAFAVVRLVDLAFARRFAALAGSGAALALLAAWTLRPLPAAHPAIRPSDYSAAYIAFYGPEVDRAYASGAPCEAAAVYEESLRGEPSEVGRFDASAPPERPHQVQLATIYRKVHDRHRAALEACLAAAAESSDRERLAEALERARRHAERLDAALAAAGR